MPGSDAVCVHASPQTLIVIQAVAVMATATAWIPQAVTSIRSTDRSGVSLSSWAAGGVTSAIFLLYGLSSAAWALAASEGAFAVGACIVVATVASTRIALVAGLAGLVLGGAMLVWVPPIGFGIAGMVGVLSMRSLQLIKTAREKQTAGMSTSSWLILSLNLVAWGLYGALTGRWPLIVSSVIGLVTSAALLLVLHRTNQHTHQAPSSRVL